MTWRVRVLPDAAIDGITIQLAQRAGDVTVYRRYEVQESVVTPGAAFSEPSLALDDDLGRALLDALAEHYGNTTGGRQQRADYEHERGRVDRLIGHLIAGRTDHA